jgi:hypothetical protein
MAAPPSWVVKEHLGRSAHATLASISHRFCGETVGLALLLEDVRESDWSQAIRENSRPAYTAEHKSLQPSRHSRSQTAVQCNGIPVSLARVRAKAARCPRPEPGNAYLVAT